MNFKNELFEFRVKNTETNTELSVFNAIDILMEKDIPFSTGYKLNKIFKQLDACYRAYQDVTKKLIAKYTKLDEDGQPLKTVDETGNESITLTSEEYWNERAELMAVENTILGEKINIKELGTKDMMKPKNWLLIDWMFEMDGENESEVEA